MSRNHSVALSVLGTPSASGGPGRFSFIGDNGAPEVDVIRGAPEALSTQRIRNGLDLGFKASSSFFDKHLLLDATLGWHHQGSAIRASDGTRAGSRAGLADISQVSWERLNPYEHSLGEFESLPDPAVCGTSPEEAALLCPAFWTHRLWEPLEVQLASWSAGRDLTCEEHALYLHEKRDCSTSGSASEWRLMAARMLTTSKRR